MGPSTGVLGTGRSSTTKMLVMVRLPALLTVPVKMTKSPGATGLGGHFLVTASRGVGIIGQRTEATAVTLLAEQTSVPTAVIVSEMLLSQILMRSEERRVGQECRSRWA